MTHPNARTVIPQRLWAMLLVLALLGAQSLGLMHRVVHAPAIGGTSGVQAVDARSGWIADIFAGHEGDPGCRLFDELNSTGLVPDVAAPLLPAIVPVAFVACDAVAPRSAAARHFEARGPPAIR